MSKRRTFIKIFVILGLILLVAVVAVFVGGMTAGGWDFSILKPCAIPKNRTTRRAP